MRFRVQGGAVGLGSLQAFGHRGSTNLTIESLSKSPYL